MSMNVQWYIEISAARNALPKPAPIASMMLLGNGWFSRLHCMLLDTFAYSSEDSWAASEEF